MYKLLALASLLCLAGCATTGVSVVHVQPQYVEGVPRPVQFQVSGDHEPTVYAARQALSSTSNTTLAPASEGLSSASSANWKVYTSATVAIEQRRHEDPFCRRYYAHRPLIYGYGYGYPFYARPRPFACQSTIRSYPVRTITWTVENTQGQVVWQAHARDMRGGGPPIEPSMRLARNLDEWLDRLGANQPSR